MTMSDSAAAPTRTEELSGVKTFLPQCVSVVMPVYNEAATVSKVIETVMAQPCVRELVVVDDCSSDASLKVLQGMAEKDSRIKVFHHEVNQGKGAALRTAISKTTGPIVLIQDADLEYDPTEYPILIRPILEGKADVVFGSRFAGGAHRVLYFWHSVGNLVLTLLSNMATNLNLTDMETCYKVFTQEVVRKITIEENRFGFEPEITAKVSKLEGICIFEVPISYNGRTYAQGKKINWKDGVSALRCILKYNFLK
jgi:glycosyltransferase involved in cell wall biosynthesis